MGIQGLLPQLKPIIERCHISKYAERRVGVDASVWLHRGTYGCAVELFRQMPTQRCARARAACARLSLIHI